MRILLCADQAPLPPTNGFRLQVAALLAELRRTHEVRVLALHHPDQASSRGVDPDLRLVPVPAQGPVHDAALLARAVLRGRPLRCDALAARLRDPLREELAAFDPDVVHVTPGSIAPVARWLEGRPAVLAALDANHLAMTAAVLTASGLRRSLLRDEARRWRRYEATAYAAYDRVVVVSPQDLDALHDLDPTLRGVVVPNGVDAVRYAPLPGVDPDRDRVVFTGVLRYAPNVLAAMQLATRVLPLVRAGHPAAHLALVGRAPTAAVADLGRAAGVEVIADVPDVVPWLVGSRVFACPMRSGTGIKNKLLEALACGVPSVATPLAVQGLDVRHGRELLVAESDEDFAACVLRVLRDDELAAELAARGRAYVLERHDWGAVACAYGRVYEEVLAGCAI